MLSISTLAAFNGRDDTAYGWSQVCADLQCNTIININGSYNAQSEAVNADL